jgi:hypothetical protein
MPVPLTKEEFDTLKLSDKKFFNYRSSWPDREFLTRDEQDAFVEGRYPNVRHLVAMLLEKAPEELRKTHAKNAFALVPESLRAIAGCKMTYGSFYIVADDGDLVPCSLCDGYLTSLSGKAIGIGGSRNGCFVFRYRNRYARVLPGISKGDGYFIGADYVGTYNFFDGEPICDGDDVYMFRRTNGSVFAPFLPFESIQSLVPVHSQKYFIGHETILLDGTKYVEMFLKNSKETSDSDPDF